MGLAQQLIPFESIEKLSLAKIYQLRPNSGA
jgi:hypothetical protein